MPRWPRPAAAPGCSASSASGSATPVTPCSRRRRQRLCARLSAPERGATERELEVLAFLGAGRSNLQIARRLHLSEATVKGYVSRLLVKLDCDNRTQAGLLAHEAGLGSADA